VLTNIEREQMKNINRILKKVLPRPFSFALISARYTIRRELNRRKFSGGEYYCPICDSQIRAYIITEGIASCPICESSERHRVDWIFLRKETNLFDQTPKRMLHVAPELFFISQFKKIKNLDYISIDIEDPIAMRKMDITNIDFPKNHFDAIYCSHVLEHIIDDSKAISELYRVCKPKGWALLQVPITSESTFEDPTITKPEERKKVFGQEDHVRSYGLDYIERMKEAGFNVTKFSANKVMTIDDFRRMGVLQRNRFIFYCIKPT
jgi:predicted SAM-dependent methyltransferase